MERGKLTAVTTTGPTPQLVDALAALRDRAAAIRLPLELPGVDAQRHARVELVNQLDDYVLPRLRRPDAPLLVVVGGSTGAGKSTLVNSLVRANVTKAGVLRPTTRTPVMVANPADTPALVGPERMLAPLVRTSTVTGRLDSIVLTTSSAIPRGVTLIDAPDINSVVRQNREQAERLMAAADAWLVVTTAERYADAVPWHMLTLAKRRGTPFAVVLDRVPPDILDDARDACGALLAINGIVDVKLFVVPETVVTDGLLPEYLMQNILAWLRRPSYDLATRERMIVDHLRGLLDSLRMRVAALSEAVVAQADRRDELRAATAECYATEFAGLGQAADAGELFRGELLVRWREFIGRDDTRRMLAGEPPSNGASAAVSLRPTLISAAADAVAGRLFRAESRAAAVWRRLPGIEQDAVWGGAAESEQEADEASLLWKDPARDRQSPAEAEAAIAEWLALLPNLIRKQLRDRHERLRHITAGAEGPAVILAAAVLAGPPGDVSRAAVWPRRAHAGAHRADVLEPPHGVSAVAALELASTLFGDDIAKKLVELAREQLDRVLRVLFDRLSGRRGRLLDELGIERELATALRDAQQAVQRART
jgi:hypothetical protein